MRSIDIFDDYDQSAFKDRRRELGITVEQMAELLGVSEREIYHVESGGKTSSPMLRTYGIALDILEKKA